MRNVTGTYFTFENRMSTSVEVTVLPSITWHSLQILDQFFPFISLPVALVSPCIAKLLNDSCRACIFVDVPAMFQVAWLTQVVLCKIRRKLKGSNFKLLEKELQSVTQDIGK